MAKRVKITKGDFYSPASARRMKIMDNAVTVLTKGLRLPESLIFPFSPVKKPTGMTSSELFYLIELGKNLRKQFAKLSEIQKRDIVGMKLLETSFLARVLLNAQPRFLKLAFLDFHEFQSKVRIYGCPLIIAPFVGPESRNLCRNEKISYVDTVGNIGVFLKNSIIIKESPRSEAKEKRRLKSLFSIKATRILRILLEEFKKPWRIDRLAKICKISVGQVHNVMKKLTDEEYAEKTKDGFRLIQPAKLLDAWSSYYRFTEFNFSLSYYAGERNYEDLLKKLARIAKNLGYPYAFTLFAASSLLAPYVRTPFVHLYLLGDFVNFARTADLKPVTSGGNVNLVAPYDEGVMNPYFKINDLKVIGKIQLYLDLINYPARGKEQAEFLREKKIGF